MDDQGNILVKRVSKCNVYIKSTSAGEETSIGNDVLKLPNCALEMEKPVKVRSYLHHLSLIMQSSIMLTYIMAKQVEINFQKIHYLLIYFRHIQLHLQANNKGDNEGIPGAVHRFPDISPTDEKNLRKPELRDRLVKTLHQTRSLTSKRGR